MDTKITEKNITKETKRNTKNYHICIFIRKKKKTQWMDY